MSYELLLLHELRVIAYCTSYELLFIARVKDKDDKVVYDKVMLKNYSLRSFYDKELSLTFVLLAFTRRT